MKKIYINPSVVFNKIMVQDVITNSGELPASYSSDPYLSDLDWYVPASNS